jgi:protein phosphatase 2C-like protein
VVDRPSPRLEARPAAGHSYRPDTVSDGWSTDLMTMRLASVRGYGHRADGRPREDDAVAKYHEPTGALVFAVADGVSAAEHPHIGATVACRTAVDAVIAHLGPRLDGGPPVVGWEEVIRAVHWKLCRDAADLTRVVDPDVRVAERLFATTLVVGTVTPTARGLSVVLAQVGDSSAWLLWPGGRYESLLAHKTNEGPGPASSAVFALPRLPSSVVPTQVELPYQAVLLVGTDGFGDPLGDGTGHVGRLFASNLERPPAPGAFAHVLDFSRETFDDDRTLLAVWHRARLEERSG